MAPGCCMSPAYVRVRNVGVCIAGSSVGKGVTEEEERKRVCACMWCIVYAVVSYACLCMVCVCMLAVVSYACLCMVCVYACCN